MTATPHTITVTTTDSGRDYDWTHPTDCPNGDTCEIARRTRLLSSWNMAALVDGRPDGTYHLGLYYLTALCLIDEAGLMLLDVEPASVAPDACHWCATPKDGHGHQWTVQAGWHDWVQPTQDQINARTLARRAA
ncbi:hypothetical protein [Streptomyces sp. NPDC059538]|uniref:hypothetical protein n=1 Tax=Streptomyces sp. NPDC059538 TaxID=3346860 RepID=UPI003685C088